MFLPGIARNAFPRAHRVFVSCDPEELRAQADLKLDEVNCTFDLTCACAQDEDPPLPGIGGAERDEACGDGKRYACPNVFPVPAGLRRSGREIFWRVDSVMQEADVLRVVPGEVWSFTFQPFPGPEQRPMGQCGLDQSCVVRYLSQKSDVPLPPSKQSSYVTGLAPIFIDDRFGKLNGTLPLFKSSR